MRAYQGRTVSDLFGAILPCKAATVRKKERVIMGFKELFFDLDGTITDPQEGIVSAVGYALERLGHPPISRLELSSQVGAPLHDLFRTVLGDDSSAVDRAVAFFREDYANSGLHQNSLYPEVPQLLRALADAQVRLFIVTSKPRVFAERIIKQLQLGSYFTEILGPSLDDSSVPKSVLLNETLASWDVDRSTAAMVGDRAFDVRAATECGIESIGVLWGYGSADELSSAGASFLCANVSELLQVVWS